VRELGRIGTLHEEPADWVRVTRCRSSRVIGAPDKRNIATGVQSSTNIYSITAGSFLGKPPAAAIRSAHTRHDLPDPLGACRAVANTAAKAADNERHLVTYMESQPMSRPLMDDPGRLARSYGFEGQKVFASNRRCMSPGWAQHRGWTAECTCPPLQPQA
jgi:hypothetical protein